MRLASKDSWKLGDTFRSNPVTVGTPSLYFKDARDGAGAFAAFRNNNVRSSANGKRIIVAGSNDGQLHAFRTDNVPPSSGNGGKEVWSFIPPNVLNKLKDIAHKSHPTGLTHQYYVDGPISVADVWVGTGDGTAKSSNDWKTFLIFGEGRGGTSNLWSSSSSCDTDFRNVYSATYSNYCGYYALDITNTYSPGLQVADRAVGRPGPLPGGPLEQDDGASREDRRQRKVGRLHRRRQQPVELHRGGLRPEGQGVLRRQPHRRVRPVELHEGRQQRHELRRAGDGGHRGFGQRRVHRHGLHRRSGRKHLADEVLYGRRRVLLHDEQLERLPVLSIAMPGTAPSTTPPPWPRTPAGISGSTGAPATRPSRSSWDESHRPLFRREGLHEDRDVSDEQPG